MAKSEPNGKKPWPYLISAPASVLKRLEWDVWGDLAVHVVLWILVWVFQFVARYHMQAEMGNTVRYGLETAIAQALRLSPNVGVNCELPQRGCCAVGTSWVQTLGNGAGMLTLDSGVDLLPGGVLLMPRYQWKRLAKLKLAECKWDKKNVTGTLSTHLNCSDFSLTDLRNRTESLPNSRRLASIDEEDIIDSDIEVGIDGTGSWRTILDRVVTPLGERAHTLGDCAGEAPLFKKWPNWKPGLSILQQPNALQVAIDVLTSAKNGKNELTCSIIQKSVDAIATENLTAAESRADDDSGNVGEDLGLLLSASFGSSAQTYPCWDFLSFDKNAGHVTSLVLGAFQAASMTLLGIATLGIVVVGVLHKCTHGVDVGRLIPTLTAMVVGGVEGGIVFDAIQAIGAFSTSAIFVLQKVAYCGVGAGALSGTTCTVEQFDAALRKAGVDILGFHGCGYMTTLLACKFVLRRILVSNIEYVKANVKSE